MISFVHHIASDHVAIVIAGHKQDFEIRRELPQAINQHGAAHPRHHDVSYQKIRLARETPKGLDCQIRTLCSDNLISLFGQHQLQKTQEIRLVIYDQDGWAR